MLQTRWSGARSVTRMWRRAKRCGTRTSLAAEQIGASRRPALTTAATRVLLRRARQPSALMAKIVEADPDHSRPAQESSFREADREADLDALRLRIRWY